MQGTFVAAQPYFNDAVAAAAQQVKSGNGQLHGLKLVNTTAALAYLLIWDALAANVVVGTTPPTLAIRLAANESIYLPFYLPIGFKNGILIAGETLLTGGVGAAISVMAAYQ